MSSSTLRIMGWLILSGGLLYGSAAIADWEADLGHGICGPWGCGPPLQALIACHLAWLSVLGPAALALASSPKFSPQALRTIGLVLIALAVLSLIGTLAHQLLVWWPQTSEWHRPYFLHRYGFTIATTVDRPTVQVLLIGLTLWRVGRLRLRRLTVGIMPATHPDEP